MVATIEEKYQQVQHIEVTAFPTKIQQVIQGYREILQLLEQYHAPLSTRLKKIQIHAFRGLGIAFLHANQLMMANRYLDQAKRLHQQFKQELGYQEPVADSHAAVYEQQLLFQV